MFNSKTKKNGDSYSAEEISKYMLSLVFASMATTAGFMNHCLCDLAGRPNIQELLFEEQKKIMDKYSNDNNRSKLAVDDCHYLGAFIWETMRLSSLPLQQARCLLSDKKIGDILIKKDTMVMMSGMLNGQLEKKEDDEGIGFTNPEKFDPERFLDESGKLVSYKKAYDMGFFPFGIGKHECPGRYFALSEIKLTLIAILRKYKMRTENDRPPDYVWQAVAVERKATKIFFEHREI